MNVAAVKIYSWATEAGGDRVPGSKATLGVLHVVTAILAFARELCWQFNAAVIGCFAKKLVKAHTRGYHERVRRPPC